MPQLPPENVSKLPERGPLPEGNAPAGLYWGMTLAVAAASACLFFFAATFGITFWSVAPWPILLLATAVVLALRHRRWDGRQQKRRLIALEALIDLAAATDPEIETEADVFRRLPAAVRAMFDMQHSYVCMLDADGKHVNVVASSGQELFPPRIPIDELPLTKECIRSGEVIAVGNTRSTSLRMNVTLADDLNLRSILQIPMILKGKTLGVLALGDPKPRSFTRLDLARASLWGCQSAVILSNSQLYAQMSQTLQDQRRLMAQRDELYAVNTEIHRPGTLQEVLQRIADLAPAPLGLDAVLVWMRAEDDPRVMVIAAATRPYDEAVSGFRRPIIGSRAETAWITGEPQVVEGSTTDAKLHPKLRSLLPCDSLVIEPLLDKDGRPLGMLSLLRRQSGGFRADQLAMARMFSLRAGAAIETARLYQQTRLDADDKAMLLRELNHRVKNNLAGIVTLLSINQPDLPSDARDWLDRAVERIRAMAHAHELISSGGDGATVAELVDRTLQSLLVARPSGVTVLTELPAGASRLRNDRAASLAMAVHEVCLNGILHGLPNGGTLTIRANRVDNDLVVEVENVNHNGHPAVEPIARPHNGASPGVGLEIVRGLVSRELRGQFSLTPASAGAIARLRFPLLADEIPKS